MIDIVLYEPEIPANTGNIARTCAATGSRLHLIEPLGFDISDRALKRAGLDYWHLVEVYTYRNVDEYLERRGADGLYLLSSKASRPYTQASFLGDVAFMFGRETTGLPEALRERFSDRCLRIPIREQARCLNLSNCAAIMCFEALRQQGFPNLKIS